MPCAVKHADNVCVHESVIALTEKIFTSRTRVASSSPRKLLNTILAAGSANKYNPIADGTDSKRVTSRENPTNSLNDSPCYFQQIFVRYM